MSVDRARPRYRPPAPKKSAGPLIGIVAGSAVLLAVVIALFSGSCEPAAPAPPVAKKSEPPAPPPPPVPIAIPVDPGPADPKERMKWLERQQARSAGEFKRWHGEWSALLPRVAGTKDEQAVRDELERIEGAAHKEFRARFRPVREKINALMEARKAPEAVQVLRDWRIPDGLDLRGVIRADLDAEIARLEKIAKIDGIVATMKSDFKEGRDPGDPRTALKEYLASSDIGVRMPAEYALRSLTVLSVARSFRLAMDARRTTAEARIGALRRDIVAEDQARRRRIERWERRLQEATRASPLPAKTLGLSGAMTFRILKFDGDTLTYGNASAELQTSLSSLSPAAIGQLLELAADPGDADGLMEAGRMAVRVGALDAADRLIRGAIRVRPAFEPLAPSVENLRRGVGALRGKAEVVGDRVTLSYTFDRADEAEDFKPVSDVKTEAEGGTLRFRRGDPVFLTDVANLDFAGRLRLRLRTAGLEGPAAYAFGFRWEVTAGEVDLLLALVHPNGIRVLSIEGGDKARILKEVQDEVKHEDFELVMGARGAELKVGGKSIWSGPISTDASIRAVVGGAAIQDSPGVGVAYASIELEGRGAPAWIRSIRSERRALVEAELSKELKALAAEGPARHRAFGERIGTPLPLEESFRDAFTDDARKAVLAWRAQLEEYRGAAPKEVQRRSLQVGLALDAIVREAPWLPLGYYYRAEWKFVTGDLEGAIADLDESLARHENFVEAHVAKAELYGALWRFDEAGKAIDAALAAVPDLARPRLTRALLHYYGDRGGAAAEELGLAIRLAPDDIGLRLEALRLARIIAGPRWPSEIKIETDHYHVRAELAAGSPKEAAAAKERAERASRTLEITRKWFEELVPGKGERTRKPIVYLFQSPESYYVHADLAHGDRLEHSLGVFFPKYQQFLFFLGDSEEETIETMIHESFHEYLASLAGAVPPWLNEGYAEYVSSARIENGKVVSAGAMLEGRAATLRRALKRGFTGLPFAGLMTESQSQFMAYEPALKYAQSWSMVHFLIHFEGGRYKDVFTAYVNGVIEGSAPADLLKSAFQGLDLAKLQAEWLEYVREW